MITVPIQFKIIGDEALGRSYIGPAKSQMAILRNQLKFQKLNQGFRTVRLADNLYVECSKIYSTEVCTIIASVVIAEETVSNILESTHLLIVIGDAEQILYLTNVTISFEAEEAISGSGCSGTISSVETLNTEDNTQVIYGSFDSCTTAGVTITGGTTSTSGTIESCVDNYYQKTYNHYEFLSDVPEFSDLTPSFGIYDIFSSSDNSGPSETSDNIYIENEWSKVLNKFMVTVFTYVDTNKVEVYTSSTGNDRYDRYWAVAASYDGSPITIGGSVNFGSFYRTVFQNSYNYASSVHTHIGFDIWQDTEGAYWLGVIDDQDAELSVFKLNFDSDNLVLQNTYTSTVRDDYYTGVKEYYYYGWQTFTSEDSDKHVRLLGYGYDKAANEHVTYWSAFDSTYTIRNSADTYYKEVLNTEEITSVTIVDETYDADVNIIAALWHPINRALCITYEFAEEFVSTSGSYAASFEVSSVSVYNTETDTTETGWSTNTTATYYYYLESGGTQYSLSMDCAAYVHPDEDYEYGSTTVNRFILTQPIDTYNRGKFYIHNKECDKGSLAKTILLNTGIIFTSANTSSCADVYEEDNYWADQGDAQCTPTNAYDYELNKWVFANDTTAVVYEYQQLEQVSAIDCDNDQSTICVDKCLTYYDDDDCVTSDDETCRGGDCNCSDYAWEVKSSGDVNILNAASDTFPYDEGWTSIMFSGTDINDNTYTNWVIYKDLIGDEGYFAISNSGAKYPLGIYDRAFFYNFEALEEVD